VQIRWLIKLPYSHFARNYIPGKDNRQDFIKSCVIFAA
jgi:hypothetical protein